jgi:uncharacterized protein (DUF1501 family)
MISNNRLWAGAEQDDPRTLVVIFLRGGADGLALVPPVGDDAYHVARPTIGIRARDAIRLDDRFSLHPQLASLAPLFHEGTLGVVHAVGSDDKTRSHFEAQDLMEHGGVTGGGWLGRFLRARTGGSGGALSAVAFGTELPESLRGAPSAALLRSLDEFVLGQEHDALVSALDVLYANHGTAGGPLVAALGEAARNTVAATRRIQQLREVSARPTNGAAYPSDDFGHGLSEIARLIKARVGLSVATIDLGGWDSHFTQSVLTEPLMSRLAKGLTAFAADIGRAGLTNTSVVVMTEFGRRVAENASLGTDHGRGSVMFVLGAAAEGGVVRARWPGLESGLLEGPGDVPVTTDYREVLTPMLAWHGAPAGSSVFPDWPSAA